MILIKVILYFLCTFNIRRGAYFYINIYTYEFSDGISEEKKNLAKSSNIQPADDEQNGNFHFS